MSCTIAARDLAFSLSLLLLTKGTR